MKTQERYAAAARRGGKRGRRANPASAVEQLVEAGARLPLPVLVELYEVERLHPRGVRAGRGPDLLLDAAVLAERAMLRGELEDASLGWSYERHRTGGTWVVYTLPLRSAPANENPTRVLRARRNPRAATRSARRPARR